MADSLRSEYERQIRVAKEEAEEKEAKIMSNRDEAMKVLEEGKADLKAVEKSIRKEAYDTAREAATSEILKYGMSFRRSTIFMIKRKYPELDLSNIDLTFMHGYDIPDPVDGSKPIGDLNVGRLSSEIATDQPRESEIQVK